MATETCAQILELLGNWQEVIRLVMCEHREQIFIYNACIGNIFIGYDINIGNVFIQNFLRDVCCNTFYSVCKLVSTRTITNHKKIL